MSEFTKLNKVSAETRNSITRKSAQTLPNNPSERGYSAEEIKRRFYQPILDAANSALAEIDRLVDEANTAFGQVNGNLDEFISQCKIKEAYKLTLNKDTWVLNRDTNMYEVIIDKETHGITNYKEIGVDMYLVDGNGNYIPVNQYEIASDATVRCFHENNGAGFLSIYVKREGFIIGNAVVDAEHVVGLAPVGMSNSYKDLDDKPDLSALIDNEEVIAKIISGAQQVNSAKNAENAEKANYANTSGTADRATDAENADKAIADQYGVNISNGYCKQNGNYPNMKAGKAGVADTAKADEDGLNIKTNYAQQNGNYQSMTVGKAARATNADKADFAEKASQDSNGAIIANTYAVKTGNYQSMTVGKSTNANNAENANALQGFVPTNNGEDIENAVENKLVSAAAIKQFMEDFYMKVITGTVTSVSSKLGNLIQSYLAKRGNKVSLTVVFDEAYGVKISSGVNEVFSVRLSEGFYNADKAIVCEANFSQNSSASYAVVSTSGVLTFCHIGPKTSATYAFSNAYTFEFLVV